MSAKKTEHTTGLARLTEVMARLRDPKADARGI